MDVQSSKLGHMLHVNSITVNKLRSKTWKLGFKIKLDIITLIAVLNANVLLLKNILYRVWIFW